MFVALGVIGFIGAYLEGDLGGAVSSDGLGTPTPRVTTPFATEATATSEATANPEVTATPEATARLVSLSDALAAGLVSMTATGQDLQELSVDVTSLSDEVLAVDVPAGLVFKPSAGSTQPMIVIWAAVIDLAPGGSESRTLSVACASMDLDQPDDSDRFTISTAKTPSPLLKVLALADFRDADFRVQQFAIWTITDNPTRSGYVGLGSFGFGSGPDDEEIAQIRSLFKEAGIDPAKYRALG